MADRQFDQVDDTRWCRTATGTNNPDRRTTDVSNYMECGRFSFTTIQRPMRIPTAVLSILATIALHCASLSAQSADGELQREIERLTLSYRDSKSYTAAPEQVLADLSPDRRAVFLAAIRAMFVSVGDGARPGRERLIHFVKAVTGIWGVRPGDSEGRHQFRLSVVWRSGLAVALHRSRDFDISTGGHVLLPGGDDQPEFRGFDVRRSGVITYRQEGDYPRLQVSYLATEPTFGEVDIDFDPRRPKSFLTVFNFCGCHCEPSNSDPLSVDSNGHSHLRMFNSAHVHLFERRLTSSFTDENNHCEDYYDSR